MAFCGAVHARSNGVTALNVRLGRDRKDGWSRIGDYVECGVKRPARWATTSRYTDPAPIVVNGSARVPPLRFTFLFSHYFCEIILRLGLSIDHFARFYSFLEINFPLYNKKSLQGMNFFHTSLHICDTRRLTQANSRPNVPRVRALSSSERAFRGGSAFLFRPT